MAEELDKGAVQNADANGDRLDKGAVQHTPVVGAQTVSDYRFRQVMAA